MSQNSSALTNAVREILLERAKADFDNGIKEAAEKIRADAIGKFKIALEEQIDRLVGSVGTDVQMVITQDMSDFADKINIVFSIVKKKGEK